ncbi:hypothetical protein [Cognatilysobacter lacus]|uniref:Uncharacterized protein n=1 Tax=Cognatilysobacter lacus TaxID=1643323 RepID=A0A5D8Z839_9GAMM|nr:hypothetical protein [Lysobacter lacus]TZF90716.1 hypothetical protein FW784_04235 [Lysobacter lacus]
MHEEATQFSRADVAAQLAARACLRRRLAPVWVLAIVYRMAAWSFVGHFHLTPEKRLAVLGGPPLIALFLVRQLQWSVLACHQLRCPACAHLLASDRRWSIRPNGHRFSARLN